MSKNNKNGGYFDDSGKNSENIRWTIIHDNVYLLNSGRWKYSHNLTEAIKENEVEKGGDMSITYEQMERLLTEKVGGLETRINQRIDSLESNVKSINNILIGEGSNGGIRKDVENINRKIGVDDSSLQNCTVIGKLTDLEASNKQFARIDSVDAIKGSIADTKWLVGAVLVLVGAVLGIVTASGAYTVYSKNNQANASEQQQQTVSNKAKKQH